MGISEPGFNRFKKYILMLPENCAQNRNTIMTLLRLLNLVLRLEMDQIADHAIPYYSVGLAYIMTSIYYVLNLFQKFCFWTSIYYVQKGCFYSRKDVSSEQYGDVRTQNNIFCNLKI